MTVFGALSSFREPGEMSPHKTRLWSLTERLPDCRQSFPYQIMEGLPVMRPESGTDLVPEAISTKACFRRVAKHFDSFRRTSS
jgi:hypothetical protein